MSVIDAIAMKIRAEALWVLDRGLDAWAESKWRIALTLVITHRLVRMMMAIVVGISVMDFSTLLEVSVIVVGMDQAVCVKKFWGFDWRWLDHKFFGSGGCRLGGLGFGVWRGFRGRLMILRGHCV